MKKLKFVLVLLMAFVLLFAMVACNQNDDNGGGGSTVDPGDSSTTLVDRTEVNNKITVGLKNAGNGLSAQNDGVRHVVSQYDMLVDVVNMTVYYEANYNLTRAQDSELVFRIYNNQYARNEIFVYYGGGTLYFEIDGNKKKIDGFGNSSQFDTFYKIMTTLDAGSYYLSEDFAGYITNGVPVTRNITVIPISNAKESILFRNVNLNVAVVPVVNADGSTSTLDIREYANGIIKDYFSLAGDNFDALTTFLVGFNLSSLQNIEIGTIILDELNIINENSITTTVSLDISGVQADYTSKYALGLYYNATETSSAIKLTNAEDPLFKKESMTSTGDYEYANVYESENLGVFSLKGSLYIPSLDIDENHPLTVTVKADVTSSDNGDNKFYIDIRDVSSDDLLDSEYYINKNVALVCYDDETTYVNLEGLRDLYLGNGISLWQLLDKEGGSTEDTPIAFKLKGLDVAEELNALSNYIVSLITASGADGESVSSLLNLDRISSLIDFVDSDGSKIVLTVNDKLILGLIGDDSATLVSWLATKLGISEKIISAIIGSEAIAEPSFKLSFDTETYEIGIDFYNGTTKVFEMSLFAQDIDDDTAEVVYPSEFYDAEYYDLKEPAATKLNLSGTLTKQGSDTIDLSKFMGAFIGDVTGVNTPYTMSISDVITLDVDVWAIGDSTYIKAIVAAGQKSGTSYTQILELYTVLEELTSDNAYIGDVYCNNLMLGIKYTMTLQGLVDAFNDLLGEDNVFTVDGVMNLLSVISGGSKLDFNEDDISFRLAPYTLDNVEYDPINELIGVKSLIADFRASVEFVMDGDFDTLQAMFGAAFDENEFEAPVIAALSNVRFNSIYEATWHDSVDVTFADGRVVPFKLSFIGDSAKLISNTYDYYPEAKLFGNTVTYMMFIMDTQNGTKVISQLGVSKLSINPIEAQPIPDKLSVIYDDGTEGELDFQIVDFPYSASTVVTALQGMPVQNFTIVIGKGSIAERSFVLPIEILNRSIIPLALTDDDGTTYSYYKDVPIVAAVTIDPYDYLLKKTADASYNPVDPKDSLNLYFSPISAGLENTKINILEDAKYADFSWNFDESVISYKGGVYYVEASYYSLKIALEVKIEAKVVDHVKVFVYDEDNGWLEEKDGQYTVDALIEDSYNMPSTTDSGVEVRVYFKTGSYRVIGKDLSLSTDDYCDGEFPYELKWAYLADKVDIDGTANPLDGGRTNTNIGLFSPENSGAEKKFQQRITLRVNCPTRRLQILTDAIRGETAYDGGTITYGDIKANKVAFDFTTTPSTMEEDYGRYEYNPIDEAEISRLPSYIYLLVEYSGKEILRKYPIDWSESSLIDAGGNLRYPSADEVYVIANGTLGEQTVTIAVHNIKAPYSISIYNPNNNDEAITDTADGVYIMNVNPYDAYALPHSLAVAYTETGVSQSFADVVWKMEINGVMTALEDDYRFPYQGGDYTLYTYIEQNSEAGILAQTIPLKIDVETMYLNANDVDNYTENNLNVGLDVATTSSGLHYVVIDTYNASSLTLLNMLESGIDNLKLKFTNGGGAIVGKDNMSVTWDDGYVEALIDALKSPLGSSLNANGRIELKGKLFAGTNIEQSITFVYQISEQALYSVDFSNLDAYYVRTAAEITNSDVLADASRFDVLSIDINLVAKELRIVLKKPYALKGSDGNYALPSAYFEYLLNKMNLIIATTGTTSSTRQIADTVAEFDMAANFDEVLLDFDSYTTANTSAAFTVTKFNSKSSCEDTFTVVVEAYYDAPTQTTLTTNVETFTADGKANTDYSTIGYSVAQAVTVEYINSGTINYLVDKWSITKQYFAYMLNDAGQTIIDDDNSLKGDSDETISVIPSNLFNTINGNTITLTTTLPDGTQVYNEIKFLPKNINSTDYQAIAENGHYSIGVSGEEGTIMIADAYAVYPFDVSALPTTIVPNQSSTYNIINGNAISFTITNWEPAEQFRAANGGFDLVAINAAINSNGLSTILLATATVDSGYSKTIVDVNGMATETQTIELYISVAQLYQREISHARLGIDVDTTATVDTGDGNSFDETTSYKMVIDPYKLDSLDRVSSNGRYYFVLPTELTATMYSKYIASTVRSTITHTFNDDDLTYYIVDNFGEAEEITSIEYSYFGHKLDTARYGNPTDTLTVMVRLPDYHDDGSSAYGQLMTFKISFLDRTLENGNRVAVQNYTTKIGADGMLTGKYYIDPYNEATFTLPQKATFTFMSGETLELDVLWTIPAGSPFKTVGGATSFDSAVGGAYNGGSYTFLSGLSQYGVDVQAFSVEVIVLNRKLISEYNESYLFENTITGLVSDIPNELTNDMFFDLSSQAQYDDFRNIADAVVPSIDWQLEDSEITYGGFSNKQVNGSLYFGNVVGEAAKVVVSGYRMEYVKLLSSTDGSIATDLSGTTTIEFNFYTQSSVDTSFSIEFKVFDSNGALVDTKAVTFRSEKAVETDNDKRAVIYWGSVADSNEGNIRTFNLGNMFKSAANRIKVTAYKYSFGQIVVNTIDFGYGQATSGVVEFVIDPLYPQIPTTVTAYGKNTITNRDMVLNDVDVVWDNEVYGYTSLNGGTYSIDIELKMNNTHLMYYTVVVHYLNRIACNIYTKDANFSTEAPVDGYYKLMTTDQNSGIKSYFFEMDPIKEVTYDAANARYKLPTSLKVTYNYNYTVGSTMYKALLNLGAETYYTDIDYEDWILSDDIKLIGTADGEYITLRLSNYTFGYDVSGATSERVTVPISAENNKLNEDYDLSLTVISREVVSTSISEAFTNDEGNTYQLAAAEYSLDPYNPSFPTGISVFFSGKEDDPLTYEEGEFSWSFDEEYFEDEDVLSGNDPNKLFIWASIKVFGADLTIKFAIKARYIDVPRYDSGGVMGIDGGTLYVLKGADIKTALPTSMYYLFDNGADVAPVPLSFASSELAKINTAVAGVTYNDIRGKLGAIDDNNIYFTVVIIDPVLYSIVTTTSAAGLEYTRGSFVIDNISVPKDQLGEYSAGQEYVLMPTVIVVEDGGYLEIDNSATEYDLKNNLATFYCKYYFNGSSALSGNANGMDEDSRKLSFVFTKPISSYDYSQIADELYFADEDGNAVDEYVMNVSLGNVINSSDMPLAYDPSGRAYSLFWDCSNVTVNEAGEYTAIGYYRNQLENNVGIRIKIVVNKQQITPSDVTLSTSWLSRDYSGVALDINSYLTIADFLRADGSYDAVNYTVTYAFNEEGPWFASQPVDVREKPYYVRITVNDYNIEGYVQFSYHIYVNYITNGEIFYEDTSGDAVTDKQYDSDNNLISTQITYTYNGLEQRPQLAYNGELSQDIISNHLLVYTETCYRYEGVAIGGIYDETKWVVYTGSIKNVGIYKLVVTIDNTQANFYYDAETNAAISAIIVINQKTVRYSIVDNYVYSGVAANVPVTVMDQKSNVLDRTQYADIYELVDGATYEYQQLINGSWVTLAKGTKVVNAGNYKVTVRIDGGDNYSSANLLLSNGSLDPATRVAGLVDKQFAIDKRVVDFNVNYVSSYYLEAIVAFNSAVTLTDPNAVDVDGNPVIVSADLREITSILGGLNIVLGVGGIADGSVLTSYSIKGNYSLTLVDRPDANGIANYEIRNYNDGVYEVATPSEAIIITSAAALNTRIEMLEDGSTSQYKWYLSAGNYGSITINKNVNVSIVGAYDASGKPAVTFDSITILAGTVGLDIVKLNAVGNASSVSIGSSAGTITVTRSLFERVGSSYLTNSVAISAAMGYRNTLYISNSTISGYTAGVLMMGGNINMNTCELVSNISGVQMRTGNADLYSNRFAYNRGEAVYIANSAATYNITDNEFVGNVIGIKTTVAMSSTSLYNRNVFEVNAKDISII